MTLKEILKANGVEDNAINQIESGMKENKLYLTSEENLDIRYGKLKGDYDALSKEREESDKLIADLKKAGAGNQELQGKIGEYEKQIEALKAQLIKEKVDAEVKLGLMQENAADVDYLIFKLKEKGDLELDENGKIKGWNDKIAVLKQNMPNMFGNGLKKIDENPLPETENQSKITRDTFNQMGYNERVKLYNENPEEYNRLKEET